MYNLQANSARFIYTLSASVPEHLVTATQPCARRAAPPTLKRRSFQQLERHGRQKFLKYDRCAHLFGGAAAGADDGAGARAGAENNNAGHSADDDDADDETAAAAAAAAADNYADGGDVDADDGNDAGANAGERCSAARAAADFYADVRNDRGDCEAPELAKDARVYCKLPNGFYLSKEARSDEKIRYTETDMTSMVRTMLFMHVFRSRPSTPVLDIINTGEVQFSNAPRPSADDSHDNTLHLHEPDMSLAAAVALLDHLMGANFATIVRRPLMNVFVEYRREWRYFPFHEDVRFPSALDVLRLVRFVNTARSSFSPATQFVLCNATDNSTPFQGPFKCLTNYFAQRLQQLQQPTRAGGGQARSSLQPQQSYAQRNRRRTIKRA